MRKDEAELVVVAERKKKAGAGRERSSTSSATMACDGAAAAARERAEGESAMEERKWQRGQQRTRPGAPGGRPGRVQAAACSPRGGQALPAHHGGTARLSARAGTARALVRGRG